MNAFLVVVLALLLFLFVWCGLLAAIARFGGWTALARRYHFTGEFHGNRWHFQHAHFRWSCNYSGALTIGGNAEGLYMAVIPPFNFSHPRLFVPWSETTIEMKNSFWQGNYMEIRFPEVPGTLVRFNERLAKRLATGVGPALARTDNAD